MDGFEEQGEWWLPGREDDTRPGTLSFDPDTGATLALFGGLLGDDPGTYPRIFGTTGSGAYTLADCFQVRASFPGFDGLGSEHIRVNQVLRGALFDNEPIDATAATFTLRSLVYWLDRTGLSDDRGNFQPPTDPDTPDLTVYGKILPNQIVPMGGGATVTIEHSLRVTGDSTSRTSIDQNFPVRIDLPDKAPIRDLLEVASDVQGLVSIGLSRISSFDKMTFWHPDVVHPHSERSLPLPIEYFVAWSARSSDDPYTTIHPHQMAFTFPDVGGTQGLKRWMQCAALHRAAIGRVMSSRFQPAMFVSDRLLNRCAALEAFDRGLSGAAGSRFKTRINRCSDLAGAPFAEVVGDTHKWSEALRVARDDVAHHLGRDIETTSQLYLADSAYWLFVMCMLRCMNAPEAAWKRLARFNELTWLKPLIQAVV